MSKLPGFSRPVWELIEERTSIRTYKVTPVEQGKLEVLQSMMDAPGECPFDGSCKFKIINMLELDPGEARKLGTYGFIKGTTMFIVVVAKKENPSREYVGYTLEKIILKATELGLGTCWIGGIFKKENFARQVELQDDEFMPAITPLGYPADKRRLFERGIRAIIKAGKKHRLPWSRLFFKGDFSTPLTREDAGILEKPLEMVRLGPSASNKQPWRVLVDDAGKKCHFYYEPATPGYKNLNKLDIGIAVCHFDLTRRELGLEGTWSVDEPGVETPQGMYYSISWTRE